MWGDDGRPARLKGEYVRDEDEQATYLREVLEVFEAEGVDNAFVNTFARYDLPHRSTPREDFDLASFGVVKVLGGQGAARGQRYPKVWVRRTKRRVGATKNQGRGCANSFPCSEPRPLARGGCQPPVTKQ